MLLAMINNICMNQHTNSPLPELLIERRIDQLGGIMPEHQQTSASKRWTARELRRLPPAQRDAILEAAAAQAEIDYRTDPSLTAFEAFAKESLDDLDCD
jgi:hypothetical protein